MFNLTNNQIAALTVIAENGGMIEDMDVDRNLWDAMAELIELDYVTNDCFSGSGSMGDFDVDFWGFTEAGKGWADYNQINDSAAAYVPSTQDMIDAICF